MRLHPSVSEPKKTILRRGEPAGEGRGAYFLANDATFDLAVAFLNSFRAQHPDFPLCLIPFDDRSGRVIALAGHYRFSVFDRGEVLAQCDRWSELFHGRTMGQYRKLAMWYGAYEQFVYIDVDTVLLQPIGFVFEFLRDHDVVMAHSHVPGSRRFVWKEPVRTCADLSQAELDFGASTGFICSRRSAVNVSHLDALVQRALRHQERMELNCAEQPLLNYVLVKSTARYTSLVELNFKRIGRELPCEVWAADRQWRVALGGPSYYAGRPASALFVHWAGEWAPVGWEKRLHSLLHRLGWKKIPHVRLAMKNGWLWRHYRHRTWHAPRDPAPLAAPTFCGRPSQEPVSY